MKKHISNLFFLFAISLIVLGGCSNDNNDDSTIIDFEDVQLTESGYVDASTADPAHVIHDVKFMASYNAEYQTSAGVTISRLTDNSTAGYTNSYSVYAGSGAEGSAKFAVLNPFGLSEPIIDFQETVEIKSAYVTNNTYAALSMRDGDAFAKKFSAEDEDYFIAVFEGINADGEITGTVNFYLADFRSGSNTGILDTWKKVDLSPLGKIRKIAVGFESSDVGTYGINTPMYVVIDNLEFD